MCPIKEVRIKQKTDPWANSEILQSIKERDKAFKAFKSDKSDQTFSTFKELRNKTQTLIKLLRKTFFNLSLKLKVKIQNLSGTVSKIWVCHPRKVKRLQLVSA